MSGCEESAVASVDTLAYDLEGLSVDGPRGALLTGVDLRIPEHGVSVLLGPGGTGKSTLLRALVGCFTPTGWRYGGQWRFRGLDLRTVDPAVLAGQVHWVGQVRAFGLCEAPSLVPRWRAALESGAGVLLFDEPTLGCTEQEQAELVTRLREHATRGAAVVVTHDLMFARAVADHVFLLAGGTLAAQGPASAFFDAPPNELAARFLRQGNCWPAAPLVPDPPRHFRWVLPQRLAGMGRPGLLEGREHELAGVAAAGVKLLVTLTEQPLPTDLLRPFGLRGRHFPIPDMGVPALGPSMSLCREVERALADGEPVAVHCHAGLGRTGTILAAVLVWLGNDGQSAIDTVRAVGRGYIQNKTQEDFVRRLAQELRRELPVS